MGIALSAVHGIFTPLHDLLTWFLSPVQPHRPAPPAAAAPACSAVRSAPSKTAACTRRVQRPLRVVRVMDRDGLRTPSGGRLVISGRMADVCAELDRLAALEATRH
ncbi:MAG: hypothetical protein LCH79_06810 [Proteobacteria bacterium]|jgi:hypothetical protein|nr:hypothetical protein [Pseudomonadota bacterium]